MKLPEKARRIINAPLPTEVIQERDGGRGVTLSYISGSLVTDILNNAFDYQWDWECEREWVEKSVPKFNPKYDKDPVAQPPVAHVRGRLTVHFLDENNVKQCIVKTGHGSKVLVGGASEQESAFKAADTDALKKAASKLGIGLELYRNENEQIFVEDMNNPWTEEALEFYKKERVALKELASKNELNEDILDNLAHEYTQGNVYQLASIEPDRFPEFVEFVQKKFTATAKKPLTKKASAKEAS